MHIFSTRSWSGTWWSWWRWTRRTRRWQGRANQCRLDLVLRLELSLFRWCENDDDGKEDQSQALSSAWSHHSLCEMNQYWTRPVNMSKTFAYCDDSLLTNWMQLKQFMQIHFFWQFLLWFLFKLFMIDVNSHSLKYPRGQSCHSTRAE